MKEQELVKSILEYLNIRHYMAWRQNSGAVFTDRGGKKGFYRFGGIVGQADVYILYKGLLTALEAKVGRNKMSETQQEYQKLFEANGGRYAEVRDLDAVIKLFP